MKSRSVCLLHSPQERQRLNYRSNAQSGLGQSASTPKNAWSLTHTSSFSIVHSNGSGGSGSGSSSSSRFSSSRNKSSGSSGLWFRLLLLLTISCLVLVHVYIFVLSIGILLSITLFLLIGFRNWIFCFIGVFYIHHVTVKITGCYR